MDPHATIRMIDDLVRAGNTGEEVDALCDDLREWLNHGGFTVLWAEHPFATSYYYARAMVVEHGKNGRTDRPTFLTLGLPDPASLATHARLLYGALLCVLADLEALGHVGKLTRAQAEEALLAVHNAPTL